MGRNRIELWGAVTEQPELRSTPSGRPLLRLRVDCGESGDGFQFEVVMAGESARALGSSLKAGQQVRVTGSLRSIRRSSSGGLEQRQLEDVASEIAPR